METEKNSNNNKSTPVWRDPVLWLACALGVLVIGCIGGVAPALPSIAAALEIPLASIGTVNSVFLLPGLLAAPAAGWLGDRFGRRAVLIPALLLVAVCGGLCFWVESSAQLLWLRFGAGIGAGGVSVLSLTILGERFQGKALVSATAQFGFVQTLATAVLPALGGALADNSWRAPFLIALLALPLCLAGWMLLSDSAETEGGRKEQGALSLKEMLQLLDRRLLGILTLEFVNFVLLTGTLLTYIPVLLRSRFEFAPGDIGLIVAYAALVSAVAALSTKAIGGRFSARIVVGIGFALYVPAYLLIGMGGSTTALFTGATLLGLGRGLNLPSLIRMVNEQSPSKHRGVCNAMYLFVLRCGQTAGPVLAGLFFAMTSLDGLFLIDACIALAVTVVVLFYAAGASGKQP